MKAKAGDVKILRRAMARIVQTSQGPRVPPTLLVAVARRDGGEKRRERVNGERKKAVLWRKELRC